MLIRRTAMSTAQHRVNLSGVQLWKWQDIDLCWSVEQTGVPILSLPVCLFPAPAPLWGLRAHSSLQLFSILCNPMDYSPPGSSVHGFFRQEYCYWVAMAASSRSSWPRDWTQVSCIAGGFLTIWATRKVPLWGLVLIKTSRRLGVPRRASLCSRISVPRVFRTHRPRPSLWSPVGGAPPPSYCPLGGHSLKAYHPPLWHYCVWCWGCSAQLSLACFICKCVCVPSAHVWPLAAASLVEYEYAEQSLCFRK